MLRIFSVCLLLTVFFSCKKDPAIPSEEYAFYKNTEKNYSDSALRILTYNIQLGFTNDQDPWDGSQMGASPKQIHDLAEIIRRANPNILLLQEVPENRCNNEIKNFIETLADSLDMNYSFGGHGPNDACSPYTGIWGNATLSKFPINTIENILIFHQDKWRARAVLRTELKINKNLSVNVYNIHHNAGVKEDIQNTRDFMAQSKLPVILGGDFNRRYENPDLHFPGLTDYFGNRFITIDRIYSNLKDTLLEIGSINRSNVVSDHWACYANFVLK